MSKQSNTVDELRAQVVAAQAAATKAKADADEVTKLAQAQLEAAHAAQRAAERAAADAQLKQYDVTTLTEASTLEQCLNADNVYVDEQNERGYWQPSKQAIVPWAFPKGEPKLVRFETSYSKTGSWRHGAPNGVRMSAYGGRTYRETRRAVYYKTIAGRTFISLKLLRYKATELSKLCTAQNESAAKDSAAAEVATKEKEARRVSSLELKGQLMMNRLGDELHDLGNDKWVMRFVLDDVGEVHEVAALLSKIRAAHKEGGQ